MTTPEYLPLRNSQMRAVREDWLRERGRTLVVCLDADAYEDGDGYGNGKGYGKANGDGDGYGFGDGYEDGDGYGFGLGYGKANGDGDGYGLGYGLGFVTQEERMGDDVRIVVGYRGWVWIGYWSQDPSNPDEVLLAHSRTLICWGTAEVGIEALRDGPRRDTKFSSFGVNRRLHRLAIIDSFEVSADAWGKYLKDGT